MDIKRSWKVAGGTAAVAGLGLGGILGAAADGDRDRSASPIALSERAAMVDAPPPEPVDAPFDTLHGSPDGESLDSPLQSPDDSSQGGDSVDTADDSPDAGATDDSPDAGATDDSVDSPDAGAAAVTAPAPAPAPAYDSPDDSPDSAPAPAPAPAPQPDHSIDSPDSPDSVDSPD